MPEIRQVTGHALFAYRITAAGDVDETQLLYADLDPTAQEQRYVSMMQRCLSGWRYRPATSNGDPVATRMKIAFHHFPPDPPSDQLIQLPSGDVVPASLLEDLRKAKLKFTESLLKGRRHKEIQGRGWFLRTDLRKPQLSKVQRALDLTTRGFDAAFPNAPANREASDLAIILFQTNEAYQQLAAFDNVFPRMIPVAGQYESHTQMIYMALGDQPTSLALRILAHEATHYLIGMRLSRRWDDPPKWLSEGVATYIQCLKSYKKENINLAAIDFGYVDSGPYRYSKTATRLLEVLRAHFLALPDLSLLIDGQYDHHFLDERSELLYGLSWLFVHYLLNADEGKYRQGFRSWLYEPSDNTDAVSLAIAINRPIDSIDVELQAYLKGLD